MPVSMMDRCAGRAGPGPWAGKLDCIYFIVCILSQGCLVEAKDNRSFLWPQQWFISPHSQGRIAGIHFNEREHLKLARGDSPLDWPWRFHLSGVQVLVVCHLHPHVFIKRSGEADKHTHTDKEDIKLFTIFPLWNGANFLLSPLTQKWISVGEHSMHRHAHRVANITSSPPVMFLVLLCMKPPHAGGIIQLNPRRANCFSSFRFIIIFSICRGGGGVHI